MSFRKYTCLKTLFGLAIVFSFLLQQPVWAQNTDSTASAAPAVADTSAALTVADSAAAKTDTASATAGATVSTDTAAAATAPAAEPEKSIDPQVYINFIYYVLLFFLVCIVVAVIGKILQIYELTSTMQGKRKKLNWNNVQGTLFLISMFIGFYGVYWSYMHHGIANWKGSASAHGDRIDTMFIVTTVIITVVLILTHIALFTFAFKYRSRSNHQAYFYPHNNSLEKIWTVIPAIVLTILVLFGFFTWRSITNIPEDLQKSALQIEVMGEQFAWTVRYAGRDNEIGKRNYKLTTPMNNSGIDFTDKKSWDDILGAEIVLPVNRPVRFHIISKDILHSFYIPDLRVQINAVPGMTNYFQVTPTVTTQEMRDKLENPEFDYVMLCNKICGTGHYNMQKKVRIVSQKEYDEWLATQTYFYNDDMKKEFQAAQAKQAKTDQVVALNNQ